MVVSQTLHIQLLGDFHLIYGNETVTGVKTVRLQSLLAYLLLHREAPQPRQRLAFLFWPDTSEGQARNNLRNLLHFLRRTLPDGEQFLLADAQTIQWNPQASFTLDIDQFTQSAAQTDSRAKLLQAVQLYTGDLLPDCYDDWIQPERESLRELLIKVLERLIRSFEEEADYPAAILIVKRLLQVDPLLEETHRQLMRLYAANGERARALHTYHSCVTLLERELGVDPAPETQMIYQRLLRAEEQPAIQRLAGTPPLIGREREWALMQSSWHNLERGGSRFVLVTGEAGIGKTRLAEEMLNWSDRQGIATARAHCFATEKNLAYAPIAGLLRSRPLPVLEKLWLSEVSRLAPEVLIDHPNLSPPAPLTEDWQRIRLFKALGFAILKERPELVLLIEDLQWCDRDTIEWIAYLLETHAEIAPRTSLLLIGTLRVEETTDNRQLETLIADLRHRDRIIKIELGSLNEEETVSLAGAILDMEIKPDWSAKIYLETEGHPLFVVEMARLLQGKALEEIQGATGLLSRVQGVIKARLSELTPKASELAEIAAVIGRQFTFSVLEQVTGGGEEYLVNGLEELWRRRIVRERGQEAYDFSHEKIREVIYQSLSTARRRWLHHKVAKVLEDIYANQKDATSGQIAAHYDQAGKAEAAVKWYRQAAEASHRIYANLAAIDFYRRALVLLDEIREGFKTGPEYAEAVAEVNEDLGDILVIIRKLDEARTAYQASLSHVPTGNSIVQARLHRKIGCISPDLKEAIMIFASCEEVLNTCEDRTSSEWWHEWIELNTERLWNYYRQGCLAEITELIARMHPIIESKGTPAQRVHYFVGLALKEDLLALLEVTDECVSYLKSALAAARETGNPVDIALVQFHLGAVQTYRDEFEEAERELQDALKLTEQTGDILLKARCLCSLTLLHRRLGQVEITRLDVALAMEATQVARSAYHIALSQANAAWVAWRDGKLEEAQNFAMMALSEPLFAGEQMVWSALWPLLSVHALQNRVGEAIETARRVLGCRY